VIGCGGVSAFEGDTSVGVPGVAGGAGGALVEALTSTLVMNASPQKI